MLNLWSHSKIFITFVILSNVVNTVAIEYMTSIFIVKGMFLLKKKMYL